MWGPVHLGGVGALTLAEAEEAGGEDGRAEEAKEDGATDELEASVFALPAKLLSDAVQSVLKVTAYRVQRHQVSTVY